MSPQSSDHPSDQPIDTASNHDRCPGASLLREHLLGLTTGEHANWIDGHLSECSSCTAQVASLDLDDSLVDTMREASSTGNVLGEESVDMIRRLRELRSSNIDAALEPTLPVSHDLTDGNNASTIDPEILKLFEPPESDAEIGRMGRYAIKGLLGHGGMGIVFRAHDTTLRRDVAVKLMRKSFAQNPLDRQRFLHEAQAVAAITHDNVVSVFDVGQHNEIPYLSMPLLAGESLQDRLLRCGKLSPGETLRIGREVSNALSAAHDADLIHRDIKPDNVWLQSPDGQVKLLDFGLARNNNDSQELTQSGAVVGTPKYMSPEQILGHELDHRSDFFSLGVLLYRMATGVSAFEESTVTATLVAVTQAEPTPIESLLPDIDLQLAELIKSLMEKSPDARPDSARSILKTLKACEAKAASPSAQAASSMETAQPRTKRYLLATAIAAIILAGTIITIRLRDNSKAVISLKGAGTSEIKIDTSGSSIESIEIRDDTKTPATAEESLEKIGSEAAAATHSQDNASLVKWIRSIGGHCFAIGETGDTVRNGKIFSNVHFLSAGLRDEHIPRLAAIPTLRCLHIRNTQLTGRGLRHLGHARSLSYLLLDDLQATKEDIQPLASSANLHVLVLENTRIDIGAAETLAALRTLETLNLGGNHFDDRYINEFAKTPNLKHLALVGCSQTSVEAFQKLSQIDALASLVLAEMPNVNAERLVALSETPAPKICFTSISFDKPMLEALAEFSSLRQSVFRTVKFAPGAIESMDQLKQITDLEFVGCSLSPKQLETLRTALPKCKITNTKR